MKVRTDPWRIVLGVIGNDIHVVANQILARGLRAAGFQVCNLGVNNQPEHFVEAALEFEADAVLVSTINGEGESWCSGLRARFSAASLTDVLLYAGGNLSIGDAPRDVIESRYREYGFNRIFHRPLSLDPIPAMLRSDLEHA